MKCLTTFWYILPILVLSSSCNNFNNATDDGSDDKVFISPLGRELFPPDPSPKLLSQYEAAKEKYEQDAGNPEHLIWYGRRAAYLGKYHQAIKIFSVGIQKFPDDPRMYRHRGHRYITIRKFDQAIKDLNPAAGLIENRENQIEPDGIPNALNIPISTLHGNIWYHLGLAYYLLHEYENAYGAFLKCRDSGNNDDNLVSSTHWLYMIQRRLGNLAAANSLLEPIIENANIIENFAYYQLCRFYKGTIPIDSLQNNSGSSPASDALKYGIANWYFYEGDKETSLNHMKEILAGKSWSSFGYIAAESDLLAYFKN